MIRIKAGLWTIITLSLLAACSSFNKQTRPGQDFQSLLHDELFPEPEQTPAIETRDDLFELPLNFKEDLDHRISGIESSYERYRALRRWVFRKFNGFEYASTETMSLSDLNTNRKYNCMSFAALFVAAARYVDVPADFQLVFAPPYWDQANSSWINNQHINVTGHIEEVETRHMTEDWISGRLFKTVKAVGSHRYTVDINPAVVSVRLRREIISSDQVLSLFYSNKSIELLLTGDVGSAYYYTRAALEADPASAVAWNNLGVLYSRVGHGELSIQAYQRAIALDGSAYSAKSNLARLYRVRNQLGLALQLEEQIREFRNQNPYYHASLAEADFEENRLYQARQHIEHAIELKHNEQHFYHRLAIIAQRLGDRESMLENLELARRYARGQDRSIFAGKLRALEEILL
jgi:tetratricopeptide (TPR) repeat protein